MMIVPTPGIVVQSQRVDDEWMKDYIIVGKSYARGTGGRYGQAFIIIVLMRIMDWESPGENVSYFNVHGEITWYFVSGPTYRISREYIEGTSQIL